MAEYIEREALLADIRESYLKLHEIYAGLRHKREREICNGELGTFCEVLMRIKDWPAADVVSRGVHEQVRWERDVAIEQLRTDYGVGFGAKKSANVVEVVRCRDCFYNANGSCTMSEDYAETRYRPDYFCADGYPKDGE